MTAQVRMIPRWQRIRNASEVPQRLRDRLLPSGSIVLQPGEETSIPRDVWRRHMYRCQAWMQNADVIPAVPPEPPVAEDASLPDEGEEETEEATQPRRRGRRKKTK